MKKTIIICLALFGAFSSSYAKKQKPLTFKNCQEAIENDCENEQKFCDMCFKKYHESQSPLFDR